MEELLPTIAGGVQGRRWSVSAWHRTLSPSCSRKPGHSRNRSCARWRVPRESPWIAFYWNSGCLAARCLTQPMARSRGGEGATPGEWPAFGEHTPAVSPERFQSINRHRRAVPARQVSARAGRGIQRQASGRRCWRSIEASSPYHPLQHLQLDSCPSCVASYHVCGKACIFERLLS